MNTKYESSWPPKSTRETMRISREHVWSQKRQVSESLKIARFLKYVFPRPWLLRVTMKNSGKCFYLFILLAVYVYIFCYMFSERFITLCQNELTCFNYISWTFSNLSVTFSRIYKAYGRHLQSWEKPVRWFFYPQYDHSCIVSMFIYYHIISYIILIYYQCHL